MRRKTILIIVSISIAMLGFSTTSLACSTFMLKKDSAFIFGHNLDERQDIPGYIFINQRGVKKTNFQSWEYPWGNKTGPQIQWVSKYGSVTFNATKRDYPDGGINEAGLYIWEMTLLETKYPEDKSKPQLIVDQWMQYQLDNYQSVAEVIQNLAATVPYTNAWHFFIADKQGDCAVIEFIGGKPVVHFNQTMPITVLCNSRYDMELDALKQYTGFGGWIDPFWFTSLKDTRFVQAAAMIRDYVPGKTKPPVEYGFDILRQMERGYNRWQVIIDPQKSMIYFNTSLHRNIKRLSYQNIDFGTGSPVKVYDIDSNLTGDVMKRFVNYTFFKNTTLEIRCMDTILKIYPNKYSPAITILLCVLISIFTSPFILWLILFIKRSGSVKQATLTGLSGQNQFQSLAAKIIAALNSICNLMLIYFPAKYSAFVFKFGLSICNYFIVYDLAAIILLTLGEIMLIIHLWKNKIWSLGERLYYLLLLFTAVFVLIIFFSLNYVANW